MAICQLGLNNDERDSEVYATFITQLRENASERFVTHKSSNGTDIDGTDIKVGILKDTRDRIPDVRIAMDGKIFILHLQNFDLYFLGYKLPTGDDWVSIAKTPILLNGQLATYATKFAESYRGMGLPDAITTRLGFKKIRMAMAHLERFFVWRGRTTVTQLKEACAIVVLMICEAARCETVFTEVQNYYEQSGTLEEHTAELIKDWNKSCKEYHKHTAVDYCGPLRLVKKDPPR